MSGDGGFHALYNAVQAFRVCTTDNEAEATRVLIEAVDAASPAAIRELIEAINLVLEADSGRPDIRETAINRLRNALENLQWKS